MEVRRYEPAMGGEWDRLVEAAPMGTFLHTRRFLSYHGGRFEDVSACLFEKQALVGVFPAALGGGGAVVSHPGATYGGLVHGPRLRGECAVAALRRVADFYRGLGCSRIVYKAVPSIYYMWPAMDDRYALHAVGAQRTRCDLSVTLDLGRRLPLSSRRRRSLSRARRCGVRVDDSERRWEEYWAVLEEVLEERHGAKPTHTFQEILELKRRFGREIRLVVAEQDGAVAAGAVLFIGGPTWHFQYLASSALGRRVGALDAVIEWSVAKAKDEGARFVDFGICTEDEGRVLNEGLYQYKAEFGGGGVPYEFFEVNL